MKNTWIVVVLVSLAALPAFAQEPSAPVADPQHVEAVDEVSPTTSPQPAAEDLDEPMVYASYASCSSLNGTACSASGFLVRCEWVAGEPGICVCSSDGFWSCG